MAFISTISHGRYLPSSTTMPVAKLSAAHLQNPTFAPAKQHSHAEKVSLVRERLRSITKSSSQNPFQDQLIMIDHIQRLGIDHLFQDEIRDALDRQYLEFYFDGRGGWRDGHDQLGEVALRFRLLRQQGYHVHADIFEKFKDGKGKYKEGLNINMEGLMNLFEASHMSVEGEDILDEANSFTRKLLEDLHMPHSQAVRNMLNNPYHKSLTKLTAMDFLQNLDCSSGGWLNDLGELAKLDLDMAAMAYKDEFLHFSKWWKDVGLAKELNLARDQPLKWYIWSAVAQPDLDFSEERVEMSKPISLLYVVDDIFDVYGGLNDLSLFTQAVNRWELAMVEELPEYMRSTWRVLFDTTNEIGHKIWIKHGWDPKNYLQKAWADFCNASLIEARWNASNYLPTPEEYLKVATVTSGVPMILCHAFFLLAESLESKSIQLLNDDPRIISSVATILRLADDFGSAKDEDQDGYDGSYLKCYMNQSKDASIDSTRWHVDHMISDAWKRLNKDCMHLHPHPFSASHNFGRACLNSARVVPLMYSYQHGHLPGLNKLLKLLLAP